MSRATRRVAAITGGTKGIGLAAAQLFQRRGYHVAVCSRSPRSGALPALMWHARLDVRRQAALRRFVTQVLRQFGQLDVLVNCAGISRWRPVERIDEFFAREILETNVLGTLWGCAAAAAVMKSGSCIVNVSSLAGKRGSANNSIYCASKFAVNGLTQSLAKELGPRGIRVNAVCPVYVETEQILGALAESWSPAHGQEVAMYLASFASTQTALGRLPLAQEVAEVIYMLAGPSATALTGQCVNVDCGTFPQ